MLGEDTEDGLDHQGKPAGGSGLYAMVCGASRRCREEKQSGTPFALVKVLPLPGVESTGRDMVLPGVGTFGGVSVRYPWDS